MTETEFYSEPTSMEPMFPDRGEVLLSEKVADIFKQAGALYGRLPQATAEAIAEILRYTNCYYSNLIEGHTTQPADIARAMQSDYSSESPKKNLQVEARAHVQVQLALEQRLSEEPMLEVFSQEFLCWIHHEFYKNLPADFRTIVDPKTKRTHTIEPGQLRHSEVTVGAHLAPASGSLNGFLQRFREVYSNRNITAHRRIVAIAASHHRLAWIHPFLDGNGRVVRLFTHALCIRNGIDGHGLWTVSRGLARTRATYYELLHNADLVRESDFDGRGNLSDKHLSNFCVYFLEQILDQMRFMHGLIRPGQLEKQVAFYIHSRDLFGKNNEPAIRLITEAVTKGEFARGEASIITGKSVSSARVLLGQVIDQGLLTSRLEKGKVRLALPVSVLDTYFPGLFPLISA
jgi:Fic family protein